MGQFTDIQKVVRSVTDELRFSVPAVVKSYDADSGTVTAKPMVRDKLRNGISVELPEMVSVPVVFPQSRMFDMRWPLREGDPLVLMFTDSDISAWKRTDGRTLLSAPTPNRNTLTNAYAIPGLSPAPVEGRCRLVLHDDGTLEFTGRMVRFSCPVVAEEPIIARKDVYAGTDAACVSLQTHIHSSAMGPTIDGIAIPNPMPEELIPRIEE